MSVSSPKKPDLTFEKTKNMYGPFWGKKRRLSSQYEAVFFSALFLNSAPRKFFPIETHCRDESHRKLFHQMVLQITATPADTCRPQDLKLYPLFLEPEHRTK